MARRVVLLNGPGDCVVLVRDHDEDLAEKVMMEERRGSLGAAEGRDTGSPGGDRAAGAAFAESRHRLVDLAAVCRVDARVQPEYYTWLEAKYSKAFYVGESSASGGRQDLEFEASVAVYVSRPHYANVLEAMLADPQHRNILETSARPRRAFCGEKTSSSSTIRAGLLTNRPSLNPDGSGRTEGRFRVPTRAPRDGRSLGARLDDGKIPGFQCRPLLLSA
jgi:hypothetical protein